MKYKTQKEVIEDMKEVEGDYILCSSYEDKVLIGKQIGLEYYSGMLESLSMYVFINPDNDGELNAWGEGFQKRHKQLITAEEFLILPKDEEEIKKEYPCDFTGEHDKAPCEVVPRVIVDGAIKTSKQWKAFEDIHFEIRKIALDAKSSDLKKLVKAMKGIK